MMEYRVEIERVRALEWDRQPAAYERLASDYACALAHALHLADEYKLEIARLRAKLEVEENG